MHNQPTRLQSLAERIAIHIEKGELHRAHQLVDEATLADCVIPTDLRGRLNLMLTETELPPRLINRLNRAGIRTVGDLLKRRPEELQRLDEVADISMMQIYAMLRRLGFAAKNFPLRRRRPRASKAADPRPPEQLPPGKPRRRAKSMPRRPRT